MYVALTIPPGTMPKALSSSIVAAEVKLPTPPRAAHSNSETLKKYAP